MHTNVKLLGRALCRLLVVVINKMDDPTVEWSQARFEECRDKLTPFLKTCVIGESPPDRSSENQYDTFERSTCGMIGSMIGLRSGHSVCGDYRCGYNTKKDVVFLPISAYTAQNIIKPVGDAAPWCVINCFTHIPTVQFVRSSIRCLLLIMSP